MRKGVNRSHLKFTERLRFVPGSTFSAPPVAYSGMWVPLITPFKAGVVDYDAAGLFVRHLVRSGVHGLVVCGTTGEGSALSSREKARLLDTVASSVDDRIPVFLGLEGANTAKMIAEINELGDRPVAGYLLPAPSYVRPSQEGIYRHFMAVADAVKRPVMIYDIPARTGVQMSIELIERLRASGDFPAIKACGLSTERLRSLAEIDGLDLMCGDDNWIGQALQSGARGAVAASAQVAPRLFVEAFAQAAASGNEGGRQPFDELAPLIKAMFDEPNPAPVKAALALQGWIGEALRLPMTPVSDALREDLHAILRDLRLLDREEPCVAAGRLKAG